MAVDPLTAKILAKVAMQAATDSESRKRILFMILAPVLGLLLLIAFILYLITSPFSVLSQWLIGDEVSVVEDGEFSILYCMARYPGRVFSREQLYNAAWGEDYELGTNTVDNTIWRLRNKLEPDPKHPTYIKTVFRVGYKIEK